MTTGAEVRRVPTHLCQPPKTKLTRHEGQNAYVQKQGLKDVYTSTRIRNATFLHIFAARPRFSRGVVPARALWAHPTLAALGQLGLVRFALFGFGRLHAQPLVACVRHTGNGRSPRTPPKHGGDFGLWL